MKRGFIEKIEENNVYVVFDDQSTSIYNLKQFPTGIKVDMIVEIEGNLIKVFPSSEDLKKDINKITEKIFVPFKKRRKK